MKFSLRHIFTALGASLLITSHPTTSRAAQPVRFNYQARLTNASGIALQGTHTLHVSLWDGGTTSTADSGIKLYGETASVSVNNGVVNHVVGTGDFTPGSPLTEDMFASNELYLQVAIDSAGNVVLPRVRLEAAPFAVRALNGVPSGTLILNESPSAPAGFTLAGTTPLAGWVSRGSIIVATRDHAAAVANGTLFTIGGGVTDPSGNVEKYRPDTEDWISVASMMTARNELTCNEMDGLIYAVGGITTVEVATNEFYNPVNNMWTSRQAMTEARRGHTAGVVNGKLYAISGYSPTTTNTSHFTPTVEEYNPANNLWFPKAPIPAPRYGAMSAVVNGKIYVIGGLVDPGNIVSTTTLEFNPMTNSWTEKAPIPVPTMRACAVAVGGRIFVFGGQTMDGGFPIALTRIYDVATDTWTRGPLMLTARTAFGAALFDGKIHAIAGFDGNVPIYTTESLDPTFYYVLKKD